MEQLLEQLKEIKAARSIQIDYKSLLPERFNVAIEDLYQVGNLSLGEGGFGKVFVATDKVNQDRKVVVKMQLRADMEQVDGASIGVEDMLQQEAEIMKDIDHPCCCKLMETITVGTDFFLVMEYCEGGSLQARLMDDGPLAEGPTAEVIHQIASAIRYVHDRSIAHRDLKPDNVVFCSPDVADLRIKLIDWGLAARFDQKQMKTAAGTFVYAAPEVLLAVRPYTQSCDIWSLGVVMYFCLCVNVPFSGTAHDLIRQARGQRIPMSDPPWDKISKEAKECLKSMLKSDPKARLTAEQVCRNPWVTSTRERAVVGKDTVVNAVTNMRQFKSQEVIKQYCTLIVARQMDCRDLREIHNIFRKLDTNADGLLTFKELSSGLKRIVGNDDSFADLERLIHELDFDENGVLDYTEFCAAALGQNAFDKAATLYSAFKVLDEENTGKVNINNIRKAINSKRITEAWTTEVCETVANDVLKGLDANSDWEVTFPEWLAAMGSTYDDMMLVPLGQESNVGEVRRMSLLSTSGEEAYKALQRTNSLVKVDEEAKNE